MNEVDLDGNCRRPECGGMHYGTNFCPNGDSAEAVKARKRNEERRTKAPESVRRMNELTWIELHYLWEATEPLPAGLTRTCRLSVRKSVAAALWRDADSRPTAVGRQLAADSLKSHRVPRRDAQQKGLT